MKPLLASKTAWVGAILTLIGLIDQFSPFIPAEYRQYALAVSGILIIVMRLMTGEPIQGTPKAKAGVVYDYSDGIPFQEETK